MSRLPRLEFDFSIREVPSCTWVVQDFRVTEIISATYEAVLELETDETETDLGQLLGATCELIARRGELPPRRLFGVIARVDSLGFRGHALATRLTVVPAFGLGQQRQHSRIWQQRSVQEIIQEVLSASLDPYGRSVELGHLQRGLEPRDYCVQYRESDFDFVCRLLEEEGISWYFVHDADKGHEVLTLCDDNDDYPRLRNTDGLSSLPLISHNPEEADLESVQEFVWTRALTPTSVMLSDYDPANAGSVNTQEDPGEDARGRVRQIYSHGARRIASRKLHARAHDHAQALRAEGSTALAVGNTGLAAVGQRFELQGVEHDNTPSEWIILSLSHDFDGREQSYQSTLECMPTAVELRPLELTRKPKIEGPQTATVVGGGEIDVDSQGRLQVQFHWQEQPSFGAGASCRIRCAQSWAGPGWGAQFIPRVGMEVVVEFLDGNPDCPLVTGCVYNGSNGPPFDLPGNATQSGWRTNSSPGGGGHNELRFEDAAGAEEIYLHGQRDWNTEVKRNKAQAIGNNASERVGKNRRKRVGVDEVMEIGANQTLAVGENQTETIGADQTLTIGANQIIAVGVDQAITIGASQTETIGANATQNIAANKTVTVGSVLMTIVGGAVNTSVGAASLEEVAGVKTISVGGSSSENVVGGKSVDAATISHSARKTVTHSSGAGFSINAGEELAISAGADFSVDGKSKGVIRLAESLTLAVGKASITLDKDGVITLEGVKINVKGKKSITLRSKNVNQN